MVREPFMIRLTCRVKLKGRNRSEDTMERLGLKDSIVEVRRGNATGWLERVPRKDVGEAIRSS